MRVQIVLHQDDFFGVPEVEITELFEDMCIIDRSAALRDLDMAPTFEGREQHEQICRAVALVLVVVACRLSRPYGDRRARLGNELLGCLIETDQWSRRIMRTRINLKNILHRCNKRSIGGGWNHPIFFKMRLDVVFFNARPAVSKCAVAAILRSTTL